jgi:hypothetical protein
LFGSASCWRKALEDREGWLATNAVWGVRPHYVKPSGYLGHETHQAGFLTWGNIVKELLLKYNPRLKIVLAGDWAKVATIGIDAVVPASRFFRAWNGKWLNDPKARALAVTLAGTDAIVYTMFHSSAWQRKYDGIPPVP